MAKKEHSADDENLDYGIKSEEAKTKEVVQANHEEHHQSLNVGKEESAEKNEQKAA